MKVLLSAYACEPGRGSEPGVGWNWVRHLNRRHEVWVITRVNNQANIERALRTTPLPNVHFVYYDLPRWARFWKKGNRGIRLYYYLWQLGAYRVAARLSQQVRFDVAHHVTFVKYWMPSLFARLPVPFVWGPVGGGESTPPAFRPALSPYGRVYEWARERARAVGEWDPLVRMTARRAALALVTTTDTEARVRALGSPRVTVFSEAGLSEADLQQLSAIPDSDSRTLRILSIGNLLHLKGFEFGLRAFAKFLAQGGTGELGLLGDGPERARLEALSSSLGVAAHVRFHGQVPRAEVLLQLRNCDVLLHPSLHDSGGWVCLEAMAAGRPVVCLDLGGPGLQVTPETGIKVPAHTPAQVVEELASALLTLERDVPLRAALAAAGRTRVRTGFSWDGKVDAMTTFYERAIAEAGR